MCLFVQIYYSENNYESASISEVILIENDFGFGGFWFSKNVWLVWTNHI